MRFITVRDLRGRPGQVWSKLSREKEVILTSNGKPIAILSAVSELGDIAGPTYTTLVLSGAKDGTDPKPAKGRRTSHEPPPPKRRQRLTPPECPESKRGRGEHPSAPDEE